MAAAKKPASRGRAREYAARTCLDCLQTRMVRKDADSVRCASCARKADAFRPRPKAPPSTCMDCGAEVSGPKYKRCVSCRHAGNRVSRECKQCHRAFDAPRSKVEGKSNSSANFCSRPCYESWLCDSKPVASMGKRWKQAREGVLEQFPFCAVCGTSKRLQVHHILPRRKGGDADHSNLIPLCVAHHRAIETMTVEAMTVGPPDEVAKVVGLRLRIRQTATSKILKQINKEMCHAA